MKKRTAAIFLTLALCLTLLPTAALAAEGDPNVVNPVFNNYGRADINCETDTVIDVSDVSSAGTIYVTVKNEGCTITLTGKNNSKVNVNIGYNTSSVNAMGKLPEKLILSNFSTGGEISTPYFHLNEDSILTVEIDGTVEVGGFQGGDQGKINRKEGISVSLSGKGNSLFRVGTMRANKLTLNNCVINAEEISAGKALNINNCTVSMSGDAEITANNISIDGSALSNVQEIYAFSGTGADDAAVETSIDVKNNSTIGMTGKIYNAKNITIENSTVNYTGSYNDVRLGELFHSLSVTGSTITGAETVGERYPAIGLNLGYWYQWNGKGTETPTITINNSEVSARSGKYGAAIGRGYGSSMQDHPAMTISINNSKVTAVAQEGAGIGSGAIYGDRAVGKLTISIADSTVNVSSVSGAGIGSGFSKVKTDVPTDITISGTSTVTAVSQHGAGIGAGQFDSTTSGTGIPMEFGAGIKDWDDTNDSGSAEVGNTDSTSVKMALYANYEDALGTNSGTLTINGGTVKAESGVKAVSLTVSADKPMMEYTLADDDDVPSVTTPINRTDVNGTATESYNLRPGFRSLAFWPVADGTYTLSYGSGNDPDPLLDATDNSSTFSVSLNEGADTDALNSFDVVRQQKLSGSVGLKGSDGSEINGSTTVSTTIQVDLSGVTPSDVADGQSLTYQWYKDGAAIDDAINASYTPTDPGVYFCAVTGTGLYRGTLNSQAVTVVADTTTAPEMPTMANRTDDSITLNVPSDSGTYQYGLVTADAINWQDSPAFTALDRNTEYSFVQRSGEGAPVSAAAAFSTLPGKPGESELQIDYVNETFTLANGVTAYSDDTCAEVIGGNDPNSSITGYIGETVYLKYDDVALTDDNADKVVTAVSVPSRPAAPTLTADMISASDTSLSLTGTAGVTYAIFSANDTANPTETIVGAGDTITFDGLSSETAYVIKARREATATEFSSYQARVEVTTSAPLARIGITPVKTEYPYTGEQQSFEFTTVPAGIDGFTVKYYWIENGTFTEETETAPINVGNYKVHITRAADSNYAAVNMTFDMSITAGEQSAPAAPEAEAVTAASITLKAPEGSEGKTMEYAYVMGADGEAESLNEDDWTADTSFSSLQPGTAYTFFARYAASGNYDASPASIGTTIYTLPNTPAEGVGYTIDYEKETATASATYEISTDGTEWSTETIDIAPGGTLYVRVKSNGDVPASEAQINNLSDRPDAPENITGGSRQISGLTDAMEYSKDGTTWTRVNADDLNEGVLSNLDAGTYQVRYAAVTGENPKFASESVEVQVTQPSSGLITYPPTIEDTEHGDVKVSPSLPYEGQTVTIIPEPDDGYEVGEVTVTGSGGELEVTDNGDGTWSFTQPGERVTIKVVFVCGGGELCPSARFTDVYLDAWYHMAIDYAVANGLMDGTSATTFEPNANMTRAMVVTILWRMEGEPVVNYLLPFTDVPADSWYTEAVRWAASEGIVTGVSDTEFAPNAEITREQLAAILHRYSGEPATAANLDGYADGACVSAYAADAMIWCVEHMIITGVTDTTLEPQGTATRAQCATMLMRFAER